jgi:hypothetical protein
MQPGKGDGGYIQKMGRGTKSNDPNASEEERQVLETLGQELAEMLLNRMQHSSSQKDFTDQVQFLQFSPMVEEPFRNAIAEHGSTYAKAVRFLEGKGHGTICVKWVTYVQFHVHKSFLPFEEL